MEPYRLRDFFKDAADLVLVGFLFLLATAFSGGLCLGAALKAVHSVTFRVLGGKKAVRVFADFWKAFKDQFWFSSSVWLVSAGLLAALWFLINYALDGALPWVAGGAIASAVLLLGYLSYFFPMLAVFKTDKPGTMLKNAFLMAAGHPFATVTLLGGLAVPVLLFGLWYGTILFSVALYAAIEAALLGKFFAPHVAALAPDEPAADRYPKE